MNRFRSRRGFTLIEIMLVVGVVAIMAGMMVPLAGKVLNQRRTAATRENLKLAFEAMFGSHHRHVPNMRADFGFNPTDCLVAIPCLVSNCWFDKVLYKNGGPVPTPHPARVPSYGIHNGSKFPFGYNGPYWHGPVLNGNPVDAWGSSIRLICGTDPDGDATWQLYSPGPDRRPGIEVVEDKQTGHYELIHLPGSDDIFYPSSPVKVKSYQATLAVTVKNSGSHGGLGVPCILSLQGVRPDGSGLAIVDKKSVTKDRLTPSLTIAAAGPVELIHSNSPVPLFEGDVVEAKRDTSIRVLDLLPGEVRSVEIHL